MSTEKTNTFFGGAAVLTIGVLVVKVIGALYKIPLGNVISDEAFTDFNTAYNVYNFFLTISTAGLPVALSKTISEVTTLGRERQSQKVFRVAFFMFLFMGLFSFVSMSVFAQPLANLLGDPAAVYCVAALSPSVIAVCLMSAFRGYAQGHENMIPTTVSQIVESVCKLFIGLALAFAILHFFPGSEAYRQQMAAAGAIFGVSVGSVIGLIYMVYDYRGGRGARARRAKVAQDRPDTGKSIATRLLWLAVPITIGSAAVSIVTLVDTKLVLFQLQNLFTAVPSLIPAEAYAQTQMSPVLFAARGLKGIYDKTMTIYNLPSGLMVPLTACVIPAVSACIAQENYRGARRISESALRMGAVIALPAGVGLFVLAGPIVSLLFPSLDLSIAANLMKVLGIASIFVCLMLICISILQAYGLVHLPILTVVIGGIIKVVVNYTLVGIHEINIQGAPVGTLCCFAVISILDMILIRRMVPDPPRYSKVFFRPILAAVLMGVVAKVGFGALSALLGPTGTLGGKVATLGAIAAAGLAYLILVVVLKVFTKEDLALMPKGDKIAAILHIKN